MDLWEILPYVRLINCRFHLFPRLPPNIFFCFSDRQVALFFFLLLSFPLSILQRHHEEGNFFSEYDQSNWFFYKGYYLEGSLSLLCVEELIH